MLDSDMQPKPMAETAADATARVSMMECSVTLCSPQRMRAAQVATAMRKKSYRKIQAKRGLSANRASAPSPGLP
jgi:hypothetical protein